LSINTLKNNLEDMPTVALVSRKGGCGKSTLATHIAAYFAREGLPITLGDLDHQQSMRVWLKRRPSAAPAITGWVGDTNGNVRPPIGATHLVLDTPGGLHGLGLAKVAMVSDAIIIPVSGSVFDREAASDCWAELRAHPRVVSGRCHVAAVGMRLDRRTQAEDVARDWAASIDLPWLCSLRGAQIYVRAVENGLSIFDMPASVTAIDREQWQPLLQWLHEGAFAPANDEQSAMVANAARGVPSRMPGAVVSPAVLRVLPERAQVMSPLLEAVTEKPPVITAFSRFVPRFLRPRAS
jgi:chromosome partitioning protein